MLKKKEFNNKEKKKKESRALKEKNYKKKAQISLFIIISIIIVLSIIMFYSLKSDTIHIFTKDKSSYKIKIFVENCLETETLNAEKLIATHSGWLYNKGILFTDSQNPEYLNKMATGLKFLDKIKMPYWYYYDDSEKKFKLNIPEFNSNDEYSIKNQIKRYLKENLEKQCIKDFKEFKNVYKIDYDRKNFTKSLKVEFINDKIIASIESPIKITEINNNNTEFLTRFEAKLDNKLKIPYYLAKDIVLAEANSSFLEYKMLNLLNPYQRTDTRKYLPPFYDYSLKYDFKPWDIDRTKELIKQILSSNLWQIQFLNTNYNKIKLPDKLKNSEFANNFYNIYLKDYISETSETKKKNPKIFKEYKNYKVKPIYEIFFPTYIRISPLLGNKLLFPRPNAFINLIPLFFTEYVSVYEITAPVIFEIKESNTAKPITFKVAIETNIDHNEALQDNKFKDIHFDKLDSESSLICDPNQFISGIYSMNITDPINHGKGKLGFNTKQIGVENAIVSFNCKGLTTCFIGTTKINGKYTNKNITQFKFRLPINCNPGKLEIKKFGHRKIIIDNLNPQLGKNVNLGTYEMPSQKKMKLKIKIIKRGTSKFSAGRNIDETEKGFIIFNCLNDSSLINIVEFNKTNINNLSVELSLCNYKIEGFIITNKTHTIPSEEKCFKIMGSLTDVLTGGKKKCATIPEIKLDAWMTAGIRIPNFKIEKGILLGRNQITVPLIDYGIPHNFDDITEFAKSRYSSEKNAITPYFD